MNRKKAIIFGATAAVVLAVGIAIVFGARGSGGETEVPGPVVTEFDARSFAESATATLASGDTTRAVLLANQALELDPTNKAAKDVLAKVQAAAASDGSSEGDGNSTPSKQPTAPADPNKGFTDAVADFDALLPVTFEGFDLGSKVVLKPDATVAATPRSGSSGVTRIIWSVHETAGSTEAKKFIARTSKVLYGTDGKAVKIDGVDGYSGTDGTRSATAVYVRGRYVFEVIVTYSGASADDARATAVRAAEAFGDTP